MARGASECTVAVWSVSPRGIRHARNYLDSTRRHVCLLSSIRAGRAAKASHDNTADHHPWRLRPARQSRPPPLPRHAETVSFRRVLPSMLHFLEKVHELHRLHCRFGCDYRSDPRFPGISLDNRLTATVVWARVRRRLGIRPCSEKAPGRHPDRPAGAGLPPAQCPTLSGPGPSALTQPADRVCRGIARARAHLPCGLERSRTSTGALRLASVSGRCWRALCRQYSQAY